MSRFAAQWLLALSTLIGLCVFATGCFSPVNKTSDGTQIVDDSEPPSPSGDSPNGDPPDEPGEDGKPDGSEPPDPDDGDGKHQNRLADETSPYLLLHAHNPVDWYPWGPEALAKAKKENKIIFLSVGYSSCHWCHVMERESFVDKEIAAFLNKHYVCIKVDREERPDVDSIYMTAVQLLTRRGGWPMSVFMTPDAKPFFGGTYFPARDDDRPGATGFLTIIQKVQEIWEKEEEKIESDAERLTEMVKLQLDSRTPVALEPLDRDWLHEVQTFLAMQHDEQYGGFGYSPLEPNRPKFPEPSNLIFLIDRIHRLEPESPSRQECEEMLFRTLDRMAMGGIRDHLGGGFHRYSVDRFWHIPHFEKMLYDNGQLATVYSEAYALTKREDYKRVVDEMLEFVLREMTAPEGGFYSALDAESEDEEGKFYRWEKEEVGKVLEGEDLELFSTVYGLDQEPNFEGEYFAPQLAKTLTELAEDRELSFAELDDRLHPLREKLLKVRGSRPRPLTDTKILTSWNGLMIRGFADAGRCLENEEYTEAAIRAAEFVLDKLRTPEGRLLRTSTQGQSKLNAYLDDYAFLVDGLLALHRTTGDQKWLSAADELTATQLSLFWDKANGGFFFTPEGHESLLARIKSPYDGAQPAGNSVSAANLLYLAKAVDKPEYREKADRVLESLSGLLQARPALAPRLSAAVAGILPEPEVPVEPPVPNGQPPAPPETTDDAEGVQPPDPTGQPPAPGEE